MPLGGCCTRVFPLGGQGCVKPQSKYKASSWNNWVAGDKGDEVRGTWMSLKQLGWVGRRVVNGLSDGR